MKNGFDYSQFIDYMNNFEKMYKEFDIWLRKFLLQQAQRCVSQAKSNTPVDTGFLRESFTIGKEAHRIVMGGNADGTASSDYESSFAQKANIDDIQVVGNTLQVTISNNAEYASDIEYGHAYKNGNWYNGKFMLTIAISNIERAMPKRFESALKSFLTKWGLD